MGIGNLFVSIIPTTPAELLILSIVVLCIWYGGRKIIIEIKKKKKGAITA